MKHPLGQQTNMPQDFHRPPYRLLVVCQSKDKSIWGLAGHCFREDAVGRASSHGLLSEARANEPLVDS